MLSNSEAQIENGVPYKKCVMQCLPWRTSTQVQNTITHYFKLNSIPGQDILSKQQNNYTQGRNGSKTLIARTWKKDLNNFGSLLLFLGHENSYTPWLIFSESQEAKKYQSSLDIIQFFYKKPVDKKFRARNVKILRNSRAGILAT